MRNAAYGLLTAIVVAAVVGAIHGYRSSHAIR